MPIALILQGRKLRLGDCDSPRWCCQKTAALTLKHKSCSVATCASSQCPIWITVRGDVSVKNVGLSNDSFSIFQLK